MNKAPSPSKRQDPTAYAEPSLKQARALHAFEQGAATAEQQKTLFRWFITELCGAGHEVMAPGQADVTAYRAGRLSVALQLGWILNQPVESFRKRGEIDE